MMLKSDFVLVNLYFEDNTKTENYTTQSLIILALVTIIKICETCKIIKIIIEKILYFLLLLNEFQLRVKIK